MFECLVIGGLLSAHLLAKRMNVSVDSSWPCTGPLLDLAVALAKKLLPAFDTATGNSTDFRSQSMYGNVL